MNTKFHAKRTFGALFALCIAVLGLAFLASPASAHSPSGEGTCSGVTAKGEGYEAGDTNTLGVRLDGGPWTTKTFSITDSVTIPVPQDGQTHTWEAYVHTTNANQAYSHDYSGNVGPCGQSQPPNETAHKTDDRTSCENGVEHREWDEVTTYSWNGQTWVPTTTVQNDTGWVHVRDLTAAEKAELNCTKPPQPPAETREVQQSEESCTLGGVHTWTDVYTTEYVWDADSFSWVAGQETGPIRTNDAFTPYSNAQLKDCAEVKGEQTHGSSHHHPSSHPSNHEVVPTQVTVPTQVESGLAGSSVKTAVPVASAAPAGSGGVNRGLAVAGFGLLTILAAAVVRKNAL